MRHLELRVPPLALCAGLSVVIVALGHCLSFANLPFPGHQVVAVCAMLIGASLAAAGVVQFRLAKTSVNPLVPSKANSVVASGIYRLSRNPMYLGMAVAVFGVAAWHSTLFGYLLVPLFCVYITEYQIKPEERALLATFGQEFAAYMAKVRRWI